MIGLMKLSVRRPIMTLGLMLKMIGLMKLGVIDDLWHYKMYVMLKTIDDSMAFGAACASYGVWSQELNVFTSIQEPGVFLYVRKKASFFIGKCL